MYQWLESRPFRSPKTRSILKTILEPKQLVQISGNVVWGYIFLQMYLDRQAWANSVDPDELLQNALLATHLFRQNIG